MLKMLSRRDNLTDQRKCWRMQKTRILQETDWYVPSYDLQLSHWVNGHCRISLADISW